MEVFTDDGHCDGFENTNTIVIKYSIPSDIQKSYHVNPGQRHRGKCAVAYLPNNGDGRSLLKRLKYAFMHGLTFSVGTSLTTNAQNQCTWSSVHHKTKRSDGAHVHGFPDPNYFKNCNDELDGLHVPAANALDKDGRAEETDNYMSL
jgi:deltex-like protein